MVTIDSYSEANRDDVAYITGVHPAGGARSAIGQSFTGLTNYNVIEAKFYLMKTGVPVGNLQAVLYAHSGVFGASSVPTGAALASSASVAMAGLGGAYALVSFAFPAPYYKLAALKYCIELQAKDAVTLNAATDYIHVGEDTSAPGHGGNQSTYFGGWLFSAAADVCFYVNGTLASIKGNVVGKAMASIIASCKPRKLPVPRFHIRRC